MDEKAGPTHSAEDYAAVLSEIMETRLPSEQMKAVNTLLKTSNKDALQAIIDNMSDDDFGKFTTLQNYIIDGTYETMMKVSKKKKKKKIMSQAILQKLLIFYYLVFQIQKNLLKKLI